MSPSTSSRLLIEPFGIETDEKVNHVFFLPIF